MFDTQPEIVDKVDRKRRPLMPRLLATRVRAKREEWSDISEYISIVPRSLFDRPNIPLSTAKLGGRTRCYCCCRRRPHRHDHCIQYRHKPFTGYRQLNEESRLSDLSGGRHHTADLHSRGYNPTER